MDIQWYPGHMTKAKRKMMEDRKLIDVVAELLDARAPLACRNPDIGEIAAGKERVIVLNKADLADPRANEAWKAYFEAEGAYFIALDARVASSRKALEGVIDRAGQKKRERDAKRGIKNRPVRVMVCGIPNVGKSTLINTLAGRASAKTGNKPGVTKGNQWIRLNKNIELLDTPGILWPKFDDEQIGLRLAFLGSVNDQILERVELACELAGFLDEKYPGTLREHYGDLCYDTRYGCIEEIARVKKCLKKGGEPDTERAAAMLLDDFRSGRLGKITLETPQEN